MTDKLSAEAAAQPYKQARETQDEVDALRAHAAAAERVADKLRAQRDELLAALINLDAWCALTTRGELAELSPARMDARSAIARCKEE